MTFLRRPPIPRTDTQAARTGITRLLADLSEAGIRFNDLHTTQSSLEEIFVSLVRESRE